MATTSALFEMLNKSEIEHIELLNEDGFLFIEMLMNKSSLGNYRVTINHTKGKTRFEKLKSADNDQ